jgi:hypothetical protein
MHTYRDALGARTVWVLYPGSVFKFYPASREHTVARIPTELPPTPAGVGSIPLTPRRFRSRPVHDPGATTRRSRAFPRDTGTVIEDGPG